MADETNGTEQEPQGHDGQAQGRLQGAMPLVVSVAAAAAAGAIAVVARRALSGDGRAGGGDEQERDPTSFEDLDQVADDFSRLVDQLRSAAAAEGERDSKRLVEIADAISEYADQAASAFEAAASGSGDDEGSGSRVTDDLMSRVKRLTAKVSEQVGVGSSRGESGDS
jgi:hypothetical protein